MIATIVLSRPFPLLGLAAGDVIIVEPGAPEPLVLYRALPPNFGAVLGVLEEGAGEPLSPELSLEELAAVVGQSSLYRPVPGGGARPRARVSPTGRRRHLWRVK